MAPNSVEMGKCGTVTNPSTNQVFIFIYKTLSASTKENVKLFLNPQVKSLRDEAETQPKEQEVLC